MNHKLRKWRESGKHLPDILKDFHDAKDVFRAMHEMIGDPPKNATVRQPSCVEGHCYTIDCFLWFMARHGYTLQKSRANQEFESLEVCVQAHRNRREQMLAHVLAPKGSNTKE